MKKLIGVAVAALVLAPWTVASAAPPNLTEEMALACENGTTLTVSLAERGPQARAFVEQQGVHARAFSSSISGTLTVRGVAHPVSVSEGPSQTLVNGSARLVSETALKDTVRCTASYSGEYTFELQQYDLDLVGLDQSFLGEIGTFAGAESFSAYLGTGQLDARG